MRRIGLRGGVVLMGLGLAVLGGNAYVGDGERRADEAATLKLPGVPLRGSEVSGVPAVLRLSYPREMRAHSTSIVSAQLESGTAAGEASEVDDHGAIRLSSSAFRVSPDETIRKPAGTPLPTQYVWTITPEDAGAHKLLLDVSGLAAKGSASSIIVNDRIGSGPQLVLDVDVLNTFGFTPWSSTLLNGAALVTTILGSIATVLGAIRPSSGAASSRRRR